MEKIFKLLLSAAIIVSAQQVSAQQIRGRITETATNQPIPGASVIIDGAYIGVTAAADGTFVLNNVPVGTYTVSVTMLSYKKFTSETLIIGASTVIELNVELEEENYALDDVVVTARRSTNTEMAIISQIRTANVVASGVSAQQISRTQEKDASEVVKRIPGISIRDDKYVIVRGLPQRYNNTWINGAAVPSTESDSRAFSFDIIPSSQIDNLLVVKTLAAEYPADYSGGFIMITTKAIPDKNQTQIRDRKSTRLNSSH